MGKVVGVMNIAIYKECLRREVIRNDSTFSWLKLFHRHFKCPDRRFYFWWRTANLFFLSNNTLLIWLAYKINRNLISKYGTEIQLGTKIGPGLRIGHFHGITINMYVEIGENFHIRQNTTIGRKDEQLPMDFKIGDNVDVGANSCIIGNKLIIGNNVKIGAMSFINKNIPENCTVYTKKLNEIVTHHHD